MSEKAINSKKGRDRFSRKVKRASSAVKRLKQLESRDQRYVMP